MLVIVVLVFIAANSVCTFANCKFVSKRWYSFYDDWFVGSFQPLFRLGRSGKECVFLICSVTKFHYQ